MFKERSKVLFVCAILATIYDLYLIIYFGSTFYSKDSTEVLGGLMATALLTPHIIMVTLGAIFSWLGFGTKKSWPVLVAAILFSIATVLFIPYAFFTIPLIVLGFIGYSLQKKLIR